jgi:hypothetical protein
VKVKVESSNGTGQPVWCDRCYIRIAPNEIRTIVSGKAYHNSCYSKIRVSTAKAGK